MHPELAPAEENDYNIERELLAIVYGCQRFHQYTFGREVTVHIDHKPLQSILSRAISKTKSPRLQHLLMKLQPYTL